MKFKNFYFFLLLFSLSVFTFSCSNEDDPESDPGGNPNGSGNEDPNWDPQTQDTVFINQVLIHYSTNDGVTIDNPYASEGVNITVHEGKVTVTSTITREINYVISGNHQDGCFKVYSDSDFGLGLNGINMINTNGPAINIQSKKRATVYLVGGTNNRLIDNNIYEESKEDMKGTFFSEGHLAFQGSGKVTLKGYNRHAICSDDYISIAGGNIVIESAFKDGIHTNDAFIMNGGTVDITSTSDGIECERGKIEINGGKIKINSADYGIYCSYNDTETDVNAYILITGGTFDITSSGQRSAGIRSRQTLQINDGDITVHTTGIAAKAINAKKPITIHGGTLNLSTAGNAMYDEDEKDTSSSSGIKCDENLTINGGSITISSSGSGGKGINIDGNLFFNNGTVSLTTTGNEFTYGDDNTAPKALNVKENISIKEGSLTIKTSGTKGKGIDCKKVFTIENGTIAVEAYEDAVNAGSSMTINGGNIYCTSDNNDGIVSDGSLTIHGGIVVSSGNTGKRGIYSKNNTLKIAGGTVVGTGSANTTPNTSLSTRNSVLFTGKITGNQPFYIESANGNGILTYNIARSYDSISLLFSSPELSSGTSYTIYTGGEISGGTDFYGLYSGSSYNKGNSVATFTVNAPVSTVTGD